MLVVRVHNLVPKEEWKTRYERINRVRADAASTAARRSSSSSCTSARTSSASGCNRGWTTRRKRWKFSAADLDERKLWDDYQRAYEDALTRCNTKHAPWYIVPANRKWYRNLVVSQAVREALEGMNPQVPPRQTRPRTGLSSSKPWGRHSCLPELACNKPRCGRLPTAPQSAGFATDRIVRPTSPCYLLLNPLTERSSCEKLKLAAFVFVATVLVRAGLRRNAHLRRRSQHPQAAEAEGRRHGVVGISRTTTATMCSC